MSQPQWEIHDNGVPDPEPTQQPLRGRWWYYVCALVVVAGIIMFFTSCDTGARKDLPQENQTLDSSTASVYLFPDKFPNVTHKCADTTGMWTTTQGNVWIVYEDRLCGGDGQMMVFSNVSGSRPTEGGGEP